MSEVITSGLSKRQSLIAELAVKFCLKKFCPRKYLEVSVVGTNILQRDGNYGAVEYEVDDSYRPRYFTIEIDKGLDDRMFLLTSMHEMVHVKQYATGEYKQYTRPEGMHRWQSQKFYHEPDYWDQPWEIEAHGREKGLAVRFLDRYFYLFDDIVIED